MKSRFIVLMLQFGFWVILGVADILANESVREFSIEILRAHPNGVREVKTGLICWDILFWFILSLSIARLVVLVIKMMMSKVAAIVLRIVEIEVFLLTAVIGASLTLDMPIPWVLLTILALAAPIILLFRDTIDDMISGIRLVTAHNMQEQTRLNISGLGAVELIELNLATSILRLEDGRISKLRNSILQNTVCVMENPLESLSHQENISRCVFDLEAHASIPLEILRGNVTAAALHAGWREQFSPIEIHATGLSEKGLKYRVRVPHERDMSREDFRSRLLIYLAREQIRAGIPRLGAPITQPDK